MPGGRRRSMAGSEFSLPPDGAEAAALLDDMATVPVEISFGAPPSPSLVRKIESAQLSRWLRSLRGPAAARDDGLVHVGVRGALAVQPHGPALAGARAHGGRAPRRRPILRPQLLPALQPEFQPADIRGHGPGARPSPAPPPKPRPSPAPALPRARAARRLNPARALQWVRIQVFQRNSTLPNLSNHILHGQVKFTLRTPPPPLAPGLSAAVRRSRAGSAPAASHLIAVDVRCAGELYRTPTKVITRSLNRKLKPGQSAPTTNEPVRAAPRLCLGTGPGCTPPAHVSRAPCWRAPRLRFVAADELRMLSVSAPRDKPGRAPGTCQSRPDSTPCENEPPSPAVLCVFGLRLWPLFLARAGVADRSGGGGRRHSRLRGVRGEGAQHAGGGGGAGQVFAVPRGLEVLPAGGGVGDDPSDGKAHRPGAQPPPTILNRDNTFAPKFG